MTRRLLDGVTDLYVRHLKDLRNDVEFFRFQLLNFEKKKS